LANVQDLVRKVDAGSTPLLKRLPEMAQTLQATLERAAHLVASTDTGYGGDSQVKRDLDRMLVEINDSARSVRLLADYLSAHPDALIQGRSGRASEK
jgi:paraquat-inducible protein B